ncbi:MAG: polyribonucleotide nucleotidyltransferase [Epsilonproteobacteria bacterium]|nr:MAG: polyribonucleotide nucleotidyltransferase [Campylobacterota bacterium]RLA67133.1 MAG: polyribonucleotide nucleotidyltransferase [Campylobacterota bacterium]
MNENKKEFTVNLGGKDVTIESGRLAKQADGSVLVSSNGTQVLVTVCSAKDARPGQDFFPLTVEYVEKFYSAGKFLGGFMKREARPSTQETLNARLIDRPIRPLFPAGYMNETVVSATVLSYNEKGDPEMLAGIGASAALHISDIPFEKAISTCKVGRINGELVINPDREAWVDSDLEVIVSSSHDAILMVEGEGDQIPESETLEAILFAHEANKGMVELIDKMRKEIGKPKREFVPVVGNTAMLEAVKADFADKIRAAISIVDKLDRYKAQGEVKKEIKAALEANPEKYGLTADDDFGKEAEHANEDMLYNMMRSDILDHDKRIGDRGLTQVRPIECETDILATPHGSSLFTRGETQVLATVTVGGSKGEQMSDRIVGLSYSPFYLHYNFPGYSVGEARTKFNVSRRELGHGNLAERAIKKVLPSKEDFNYTMRVACEVLESNGSSSMGSVCSGSMALMDAGVPLLAPVGGIAMGLVKEGDRYKILTDILGDEDHLGDMDFKVAGTEKGITAIQMDIKIDGLPVNIMKEAMAQAREGRLHILGEMAKTISTTRKEFKEGVPRMQTHKIPVDKIGALIGPGGKNIKGLQEQFDVTVEVEEDGTVKVLGTDPVVLENAISTIALQITGPELGSNYTGKVVTIKEYGAFVDIVPGISGLLHISEIANERVSDVNEYLSEGDAIEVQVLEIDRMGRIKLSAKAVKPLEKKSGE